MNSTKIGNGSIPLRLGNLINAEVYGGPYREIPNSYFGVKMAREINMPCDADVPTEDFNVPEIGDLRVGIMRALMAMTNGQPVYVGCMGGIGRTGLFLAALAKIQIEYRRSKHRKGRGDDPVKYVRNHFIPHAVETEQQKQYIAALDVSDFVDWIDVTQRAMGLTTGFQKLTNPSRPGTAEYELDVDEEVIIKPEKTDAEISELIEMANLVERDLDWIDSLDADSADDIEEGDISDEQMADIYETLDEHDDRLERLEKALTKPTIFERILSLFR